MVIFGLYFEGESKGLDDRLNPLDVSKREHSRENHGFLVSNWEDANLRKDHRSLL